MSGGRAGTAGSLKRQPPSDPATWSTRPPFWCEPATWREQFLFLYTGGDELARGPWRRNKSEIPIVAAISPAPNGPPRLFPGQSAAAQRAESCSSASQLGDQGEETPEEPPEGRAQDRSAPAVPPLVKAAVDPCMNGGTLCFFLEALTQSTPICRPPKPASGPVAERHGADGGVGVLGMGSRWLSPLSGGKRLQATCGWFLVMLFMPCASPFPSPWAPFAHPYLGPSRHAIGPGRPDWSSAVSTKRQWAKA